MRCAAQYFYLRKIVQSLVADVRPGRFAALRRCVAEDRGQRDIGLRQDVLVLGRVELAADGEKEELGGPAAKLDFLA